MIHTNMDWFVDAKFGIFVHWGIYSVGQYEASWSFFNDGHLNQDPNDSIPYDLYMAQRHAFFARRYRPDAWADLFYSVGAKYSVLTTKHSDGFALWDTKESWSVVRDSPAGRDLVGPFCDALRAKGLKAGLYYSHLDWSHADYRTIRHPEIEAGTHCGHRFAFPEGPDQPERWEQFLRFHRLQIQELCERYGPDLLWFDGDWERTSEQWRFNELVPLLREWAPGVILNNRIEGGDYFTPEQGMPSSAPPGPWELCLTMNRSWSHAVDPSYKTSPELIQTLAECAGMGGNLLLNVSPLGDGTLFYEQVRILREMGRWLDRNGIAIFGTRAGLPHGHWYGPSTLSPDGKTLYLFLFSQPAGEVAVKGIRNQVLSATIVGADGTELPRRISGGASWVGVPGVLWLDIPAKDYVAPAIAIRLELEGPLDLQVGFGQVITQN